MEVGKKAIIVMTFAVLGGGGLVLTTGCSVDPAVKYVQAPPSAASYDPEALIDSYALQQNRLRIEYKKPADAKTPSADLTVADTRIEDPRRLILIVRSDSWKSRTKINLTKVENTNLIDTIGVEVQDRRKSLLENVGTVLKTIAPLALAASGGGHAAIVGCESFPGDACEFVPSEAQITNGGSSMSPLLPDGIKDGGTFQQGSLAVSWGAVPSTAVRTNTVLTPSTLTSATGIYFAACRDITIAYAVTSGDGTSRSKFIWRGKFADPRWLDYVAFPRKGSVRMHSQCGVSTSSEGDPTDSTDAIIAAAVTQAAAVKDAIDKAKKDSSDK